MRHVFFQLILFLLILITTRYTTADLTKGLVVHFTFDNVKGKWILDESENNLDAEIIKNTKFVEGKYGNAISITGETEDCVNIPSADALEISEEITMMAWVYHENWQGRSSQWFDKGIRTGDLHRAYGMAVYDEKDIGVAGGLKDGSGIGIVLGAGIPQHQQMILVDNTMEDRKWHHIVGTVGDNGVKIYLDGESILHLNENLNFKGTNKEDLRIGCAKNKPQYAFEGGSIDEIAIWSRALGEDEVRTAMRGPLLAVSSKGKATTTWGNIKRKTF
jgi:hypothetical protein